MVGSDGGAFGTSSSRIPNSTASSQDGGGGSSSVISSIGGVYRDDHGARRMSQVRPPASPRPLRWRGRRDDARFLGDDLVSRGMPGSEGRWGQGPRRHR